jgi:RNA polymerase sigma-70 factor (ECF subfamily)
MICGMSPPEEVRHNLIRQLIEGRNLEENFRLIFERYHHAVSAFFFRQGLSPEDRRDLTQEVFVNVYQAIKNLQNEAAFVPWLFSIANHVALRHWERQRTRPKLQTFFSDREDDEPGEPEMDRIPAADPDPESRILDLERTRAVQEAVDDLPSQMQKCLKGRIYEGLSNVQIGERLGISADTVAVHIHRGIKILKDRLDRYFEKLPLTGDF